MRYVKLIACAFVGALLALGTFVAVAGNGCKLDETGGVCFREWASAGSGWAAAIVAVAAAWLAYRPLIRQVHEAKRQTDFVVGDALPDFSIRHLVDKHDRFGIIQIQIVNWNRRQARIIGFADAHDTDFKVAKFGIRQLPGMGMDMLWRPGTGRAFPIARIPGWIDRASVPSETEIWLHTEPTAGRDGFYRCRIVGQIEDDKNSIFTRDLSIAHPFILDLGGQEVSRHEHG